ncbi:hypothetical protein MNBD_GAMMA09-161 [hydrothermal vent metagenome]|uniref:Outer membrane protein beta-barrel domain-containing protein n=1 Tax=hydrothermal vent metagenome TaxID=652676 RepID=A0A3B0XIV5_9ZZZZ
MSKRTLIFGLLIGYSINVQSQNNSTTGYSLEIDPTAFFYNGYSVHLKITPKNKKNFRFGIGIYSMELPDTFIYSSSNIKNIESDVDLEFAVGFFSEYFSNENQSGWLVGFQLAQQELVYKNPSTNAVTEKATVGLYMPYAGHRWNLNTHFYLLAWFGIGLINEDKKEIEFNGNTYNIQTSSVVTTGALHLGYEF